MTEAVTRGASLMALCAWLRELAADELARLLMARRVPARGISDLVDLADVLLSDESIERAVDTLGWRWAHRVHAGDNAALREAIDLALALPGENGQVALIPEVAREVQRVVEADPLMSEPGTKQGSTNELPEGSTQAASDYAVSADAAYRGTVLVTELIDHLGRASHPGRIGRCGPQLSGGESRRLASTLESDADEISALVALAAQARLVAVTADTLRPTDEGMRWRTETSLTRWGTLAQTWLDALGVHGHLDLHEADAPMRRTGERLGLTESGSANATPLGELVLQDRFDEAEQALRERFPASVNQIYIQPDAGIMAPGPLREDLDLTVRRVAEPLRDSIVSSYRLTKRSIHGALMSGMDADGIEALLSQITIGEVAQPVRYLIDDVDDRFGQIRVQPVPGDEPGSIVTVRNTLARDTVLADRRLAPLALAPLSDTQMRSRVNAPTVQESLLEAGHLPALDDERGNPARIDPITTAPEYVPEPTPAALARAERLLDDPSGAIEQDGNGMLRRQLEIARRNRAAVRLVFDVHGQTQETVLVPVSVSGPRLRGRSPDADVERTIPLDAIVEVIAS